MKALILGAYEISGCAHPSGDLKEVVSLTRNSEYFNFSEIILKYFRLVGPMKKGKSRLITGLTDEFPLIAVVNLGQLEEKIGEKRSLPDLPEDKEFEEKISSIKAAITHGLDAIHGQDVEGITEVVVDTCGYAQLVAETLYKLDWKFNESKDEQSRSLFKFTLLKPEVATIVGWNRGRILANGHNMGRQFDDKQAKSMVPSLYASELSRVAKGKGIEVTIRDQKWTEAISMTEFSSVTSGLFIELRYSKAESSQRPIVLIGVGDVQFSKSSENVIIHKQINMSAATVVASTILSLADQDAKVNVIGLIPCTDHRDWHHDESKKREEENEPSAPNARLVLAQALPYAFSIPNRAVVSISACNKSLTGDQCGWYASDYSLVELFHEQSKICGEKIFPVWTTSDSTCALLAKFNKSHSPWMHLDIPKLEWAITPQLCLSAGVFTYPLNLIVPFIKSVFQKKV